MQQRTHFAVGGRKAEVGHLASSLYQSVICPGIDHAVLSAHIDYDNTTTQSMCLVKVLQVSNGPGDTFIYEEIGSIRTFDAGTPRQTCCSTQPSPFRRDSVGRLGEGCNT